MKPQAKDIGGIYSPDISAELTIGEFRFAVGALGPDSIRLRDARAVPPGDGVVRMNVDEQLTIYKIHLPMGIVPSLKEQPMKLISVQQEAAA